MFLRRAVYYAMLPAAVILPLWVLITRGIVASDTGWQTIFYLFATPILFVALAAVAGLVRARKSVRDARAVSWWDAALFVALWVALVASGIFAFSAVEVLVVLLVVGGFWLAVWELVNETRTRVNRFVTGLEVNGRQTSNVPPARGETILIRPSE